jgi:endonuclease YncB( thermonuclease family)
MSNIPNNSNTNTPLNNIPEIIAELKTKDLRTPPLSLDGYFSIAKVVSVYDGDTCRVVIPYKGEFYKWNVRLIGYDTPEMRPSRSKPNRVQEIEAAKAAKKFLISQVMSTPEQLIFIKCKDFDKYGRLLAEIYINYNDITPVNDLMIDNGHGYSYNGGTKRVFR